MWGDAVDSARRLRSDEWEDEMSELRQMTQISEKPLLISLDLQVPRLFMALTRSRSQRSHLSSNLSFG